MDVHFHCYNPLNTVCRAMDIARRMGMGFDQLTMRREENDLFSVSLVLETAEQKLCDAFIARLHLCGDLIREMQDA
ncbi:hypothetical protein [Antarcticimicrobium sediminis]|uniref:ACT domain-containing protein n=1 Tax=Antarcticimicrobium sediminis TaxID=2546227 RepID=A0A4R5ELI3_9RHOB|nr:hypothetical protein [Antarcticimicrobium sediminis]TDE35424.1 hypothetical protein E1B25_17410 [Antarcticimicrobium sediminis]